MTKLVHLMLKRISGDDCAITRGHKNFIASLGRPALEERINECVHKAALKFSSIKSLYDMVSARWSELKKERSIVPHPLLWDDHRQGRPH